MTLRHAVLGFLALVACACTSAQDYASLRSTHKTVLAVSGPAPQPYGELTPPDGVRQIEYDSGDLKLKGWFAQPRGGKPPLGTVIFLHGGFAFGIEDYEQAVPFLDAGYAVLFPLFRGENGNPGNFELLYGEADDAVAAVKWLKSQPEPTGPTLAFFGHSTGGAIAELTSLRKDVPVALSGSIGALYPPDVFRSWHPLPPFGTADSTEVALRTFVLNLEAMQRRHVAYMGSDEPQLELLEGYRATAAKSGVPLVITVVPGDHDGSVAPAIEQFIVELRRIGNREAAKPD